MNFQFLHRLTIFSVLLTVPSFTYAATFNVPSVSYPTIQSGVDAAQNGDTVLVAAGTYTGNGNRDIDFHGKSLTVTSQYGPTKTIIDCGGYKSTDGSGNHRGFYLHSREKAATISGFNVKNGYEGHKLGYFYDDTGQGGGIYVHCEHGAIKITDCKVSGSTSTSVGGGVYNINVSGVITLSKCTILDNTAEAGGGIYSLNIDDDGIYTTAVTDCAISGNTASSAGGGVYNDNYNSPNSSICTLTNCKISGNIASLGGGVYNHNINDSYYGSGVIVVANCIISNNTATSRGGGVYNDNYNYYVARNGMIALTSCTVSENMASSGGGVYNDNANDNKSYGVGNNALITLTNVILYEDVGGEVTNDLSDNSAVATVLYSNIQGGYSGTGNIDTNPLFINAAAGDLHLKPGSPCLGAGTPNGAPATDLDGTPRPNPPSMGAYELAAQTVTITGFILSPNQVVAFGPVVTANVSVTGNFTKVSVSPAPGSLSSASPTFNLLTNSGGGWGGSFPTAFLKLAKNNPVTFIATGTRADGSTATAAATLVIGAAPTLTLSFSSNKTSVGPGSEVTFSGVLNNLSSIVTGNAILNIPLPIYDLEYVPGSAQGIDYDAETESLSFSGPLSAADGKRAFSHSYSFKVRIKPAVFNGTKISLTATASGTGFVDATVSRSLDVDQLVPPHGVEVIGDTFSGLLDGKADVHPEDGYPPLAATVSPIPMRPDVFLGQRRFNSWLSVIKIETDSNVTCNPSSGVGGRLAAKGLVSPSVSPTYDATFLNVNDSLTLHVGIDNTSALANLVEDFYTVSFPFTPDDIVATLDSWKNVSAFTDVSNYMTNPRPKNSFELSRAVAKSVVRLTIGLKSADIAAIQQILEAKYGKSVSKAQVLLIASKAFSAIKITQQFGDTLYLNLHGGVIPFEPDLTVKFVATKNSNP